MLVCDLMSCPFLVDLWSPAGKGLISRLSSVLWFFVLYHVPKCAQVHIRIKGEVGSVKLV